MQRLMSILKVVENNLGVLHRHVYGPNWFQSHEKLEEYQNYVAQVKDEVIEIGMTLTFKEPSLKESIEVYSEIESPISSFSEKDSFEKVKAYFTDISNEFEALRSKLPADVSAKFDEYQYYFRKEAQYKLYRLTKVS
jgi:DNA-binding ferritin-like protein